MQRQGVSIMGHRRFAALPFFYGWIIVGLGLLSMGFWTGVRTSFSVFYLLCGPPR
jgi:hypothetical protein